MSEMASPASQPGPPSKGGFINQAFDPTLEGMPPRSELVQAEADKIQSRSLTGIPNDEEILASAVDGLQQKLGGYGRYQILIYFLLGLVYMRGCWHAFVSSFQALAPNYHCSAYPGLPLNESVPPDDSQCKQYINFTVSNKTEDCRNGWTMTPDIDGFTSVVSEYDLVCGREDLAELTTTMYMVGATCGVIFLAPLSERLGTKAVMLACLWLQLIVGFCLPWAGSIGLFIALKFFIGLFNMTIALCVAVMMSETFDAAHRELPALGIQFFWATGIMSLALLGYLMPDWHHLQLAISIPINVLSILYIWLIPQSLPWLLSKGKLKKAENVIKRFLHVNSLPSIPDLTTILSQFDPKNNVQKSASPTVHKEEPQLHSNDILVQNGLHTDNVKPAYTVIDLFKHSTLRLHTCILCYLFLANALAYFGIMFSVPLLKEDIYLNTFLLGLVEIPAYVCCILANRFIGRRQSIFMFLLICSVTSLPVPFIPDATDSGVDLTDLKKTLIMLGKFGITGSYSAIYLYAAEVFPTVIRNQGVGFCSFFENIGSIAAPNMAPANSKLTNLPLTVFGVMAIVGAGLILILPETHNKPLPQTIADAESRGRKKLEF